APLDRLLERRQVDLAQLLLADGGVALVDTAGRAAVTDVVLGAGKHRRLLRAEFLALQASDHRSVLDGVLGRLAERLVRPAPAVVTHDAETRREVPLRTSARDLFRGGPADLFDQLRVVRGAEADVVREDRRAVNVVVPVHRVDAVDRGDAERGG